MITVFTEVIDSLKVVLRPISGVVSEVVFGRKSHGERPTRCDLKYGLELFEAQVYAMKYEGYLLELQEHPERANETLQKMIDENPIVKFPNRFG